MRFKGCHTNTKEYVNNLPLMFSNKKMTTNIHRYQLQPIKCNINPHDWGKTKLDVKIEETMGSFSNYKANFSNDLPDTNNFLKIIFQGTDHILVKIELWVSPAMCLKGK